MNSYRKAYFAVLAVVVLTVLSSVSSSAQGPADVSAATPEADSPTVTPAASFAGESGSAVWHQS